MTKTKILITVLVLALVGAGTISLLFNEDENIETEGLTAGSEDVLVFVDDEEVKFNEQAPYIDDNKQVMVPVRFLIEELGADVKWIEEDSRVNIVHQFSEINLWIEREVYEVNGQEKDLGSSLQIKNGTTMVPIKFAADAMHLNIEYQSNDSTEIVSIHTELDIDIPILMYHRIKDMPDDDDEDDASPGMYVHPEEFKKQLDWLKENDYQTISMDDVYEHLEYGQDLPEKSVVLTFDDGYKEHYDIATKELAERDQLGVFYIPTDAIGEQNIVSESDIAEMGLQGMEIGSHSHTHSRMDEQDIDKIENEISTSTTILENIIGDDVVHFCYPYGIYTQNVTDKLQEHGYKTATSVDFSDRNTLKNQSKFTLSRIEISYNDTLEDFEMKITK